MLRRCQVKVPQVPHVPQVLRIPRPARFNAGHETSDLECRGPTTAPDPDHVGVLAILTAPLNQSGAGGPRDQAVPPLWGAWGFV